MRRSSLVCFLISLSLFVPLGAKAEQKVSGGGGHVYEKWLFRNEAEIDKWHAAGIEQGALGPEGLSFGVKDQGALFRPLPGGFHEKVDALKIYIGPSDLTEVALLLLKTNQAGKIVRSFRLALNPTVSTLADGEYVPLTFYRPDIVGTDMFALSFRGNTKSVTFGGVRFLEYSWKEKLLGGWESFWHFDPFRPHSINLLVGPLIVPDPGAVERSGTSLVSLSTSVNAYLLVFLSLAGIVLLFHAAFSARRKGTTWPILRMEVLRRFFLLLFALWIFYDLRMGLEFLKGVYADHKDYITADASTRTFRERGRFYAFADFVRGLVSDRGRYEVFLPTDWPYFGLLRYETYPALPNAGEPVSDTWVVYERADLTVGTDRKLSLGGKPITTPGKILGTFGSGSFVFRENHVEEGKEYKDDKEYKEKKKAKDVSSLYSSYSLSSLSSP